MKAEEFVKAKKKLFQEKCSHGNGLKRVEGRTTHDPANKKLIYHQRDDQGDGFQTENFKYPNGPS